jgi:uncharacterized protein YgiM (DUF1202 family)
LPEIFFFHYSLSKPETEAVFMCVYIALALLGITHFFHKSKTIRWLVSVALVLTLGFGGSTIMKLYRPVNHNQAVVVADEAEIHTGPGRNYMISFSLHDGAELRVRKKEKGWYQIELPDGRRGWLNVSHIEGV